MQYACGTKQRWSNKLLKTGANNSFRSTLEQITPKKQRGMNE